MLVGIWKNGPKTAKKVGYVQKAKFLDFLSSTYVFPSSQLLILCWAFNRLRFSAKRFRKITLMERVDSGRFH